MSEDEFEEYERSSQLKLVGETRKDGIKRSHPDKTRLPDNTASAQVAPNQEEAGEAYKVEVGDSGDVEKS